MLFDIGLVCFDTVMVNCVHSFANCWSSCNNSFVAHFYDFLHLDE